MIVVWMGQLTEWMMDKMKKMDKMKVQMKLMVKCILMVTLTVEMMQKMLTM